MNFCPWCITAAFPGQKASVNVVVKAKDVTQPAVAGAIQQLQAKAKSTGTAIDAGGMEFDDRTADVPAAHHLIDGAAELRDGIVVERVEFFRTIDGDRADAPGVVDQQVLERHGAAPR